MWERIKDKVDDILFGMRWNGIFMWVRLWISVIALVLSIISLVFALKRL